MKRIHILESKLNEMRFDDSFCAGTDTPYYKDERTGEVYEATWNGDYGFPFGYWPIDYNGEMEFCIGQAWTTHANACGIAAEQYYMDVMGEGIYDESYEISEALDTFVNNFIEGEYSYNEEDDMWVSADGSDEQDESDFINNVMEEIYTDRINCYDYVCNFVTDYLQDGGNAPNQQEVQTWLEEQISDSQDFSTQEGIDSAMKEIGMDFHQYFEMGELEGRIWPSNEMIGFYVTEQPEPRALVEILQNLSSRLEISMEDLYNYHIVFENYYNGDGEITACTISDYINHNYGQRYEEDDDEYYEDEDEVEEPQYARQGETKFIPHLANQQQKREYFQDFRNTRDRAVYTPQERAAGNLAAYHAMRYPYGENKEKQIALTESDLHALVKEAVKNILEGSAWSKYPDEDITQAELDANMNDKTSGDFANAYVRKDPMVNNIHGSTLRDMLKASMGNGIR